MAERGRILTDAERHSYEQLVTRNSSDAQYAAALLAVDSGASLRAASRATGLTLGQVNYVVSKLKRQKAATEQAESHSPQEGHSASARAHAGDVGGVAGQNASPNVKPDPSMHSNESARAASTRGKKSAKPGKQAGSKDGGEPQDDSGYKHGARIEAERFRKNKEDERHENFVAPGPTFTAEMEETRQAEKRRSEEQLKPKAKGKGKNR